MNTEYNQALRLVGNLRSNTVRWLSCAFIGYHSDKNPNWGVMPNWVPSTNVLDDLLNTWEWLDFVVAYRDMEKQFERLREKYIRENPDCVRLQK